MPIVFIGHMEFTNRDPWRVANAIREMIELEPVDESPSGSLYFRCAESAADLEIKKGEAGYTRIGFEVEREGDETPDEAMSGLVRTLQKLKLDGFMVEIGEVKEEKDLRVLRFSIEGSWFHAVCRPTPIRDMPTIVWKATSLAA